MIIVRDLARGARRYGHFLASPEKITTNILADRLKRQEASGTARPAVAAVEGVRSVTPARMLVRLAVVAFVLPALPVLVSGDWAWPEGWAFLLVTGGGFVVSRLLAARRHPDIIAERMRGTGHEDTKAFDRVLAPLVAVGVILVGIVGGFDHRWHGDASWFPAWSRWLALAVIVAGYALVARTELEDRTLRRELPGYAEYARRTGYRLVPGIW